MAKFKSGFSIRVFLVLVSALIFLGVSESITVLAQTEEEGSGSNILLILDGSGSMAGQIEGKAKMNVAKEVMTDLINDLPDDVSVGLVVYGHRSKGDCDDIEMMAEMGEIDKATLTRKIESISPRGKTPIAKSLEMAGEQLEAMEDLTTVVLVSDGEETCEGDPCALVKSLKEKGINVNVHVVGFNVGEKEKVQLSCIADAGGGRYFTANNADQLKEALSEVREEVVVKKDVPKMNPLPMGGDRKETAVPISAGDYGTDHEIAKGLTEYFAVKLSPGQTLSVGFRTPDTTNPYAGASIYNEEGNLVIKETIIGSPGTLKSVSWSPDSNKDESMLYIGVGNDYDENAIETAYYITIEDNFDIGSATDAGEIFDNAINLEPGKSSGHLSGKRGEDKKDFYAVKMNAGQKVSVKITPESDTGFKLTIFDQDRVIVNSKASANPGAITRISWTAPEDQEVVYILIEPHRFPGESSAIKYDMDVSLD
ncbi:MAG: VWA domain-containing protein [Deltaproteobacteria bacterium]